MQEVKAEQYEATITTTKATLSPEGIKVAGGRRGGGRVAYSGDGVGVSVVTALGTTTNRLHSPPLRHQHT